MKYYFFRDLDHNGNFEDGKSYHAAGMVKEIHCELSKPSESGKDLVVYFMHPFTQNIEYSWRSLNEVELFEVNQYDWNSALDFYDR